MQRIATAAPMIGLLALAGTVMLPETVLGASGRQSDESGFVLAIVGDYGVGARDRADADPENEAAVAHMIDSWNVDHILTVGDNNYNHGQMDTIDENIGQYYADYIYPFQGDPDYRSSSAPDDNRFWPAAGDHDYTNPVDGNADAQLWYFSFLEKLYYNLDLGTVNVFIADSTNTQADGNDPDSVQAEWFKQQMLGSDATWNLFLQHNPVYSTWLYNVPNMPDSYDYPERPAAWPFDQWGVDVDAFIAGDEHVVERLFKDNRPYLINGTGGAKLMSFPGISSDYGFGMENPQIPTYSLFRYAQSWGAMKVYGDSETITFEQWAIPDVENDPDQYLLLDSYTLRSDHPCFKNTTDPICQVIAQIREPIWSAGRDIIVAPYRGYWGHDNGMPPENSIQAMADVEDLGSDSPRVIIIDVAESQTGQESIAFRDENLLRLAGENETVASQTSADLAATMLLDRDGDPTTVNIPLFSKVLSKAKALQALVIVRINDLGEGEWKWFKTVESVIQTAQAKSMEKYVAIITPYAPEDLEYIDGMTSFYYVPVVSGSSEQEACDYIDDWQSNYGSNVLAFEVDFSSTADPLLQSFLCTTEYDTESLAAGVFDTNVNVMEYIKNATGKRALVFAEDADGRRGTANGVGGWSLQSTDSNMRTDPIEILEQDWTNFMIVGTRRPDVWGHYPP